MDARQFWAKTQNTGSLKLSHIQATVDFLIMLMSKVNHEKGYSIDVTTNGN